MQNICKLQTAKIIKICPVCNWTNFDYFCTLVGFAPIKTSAQQHTLGILFVLFFHKLKSKSFNKCWKIVFIFSGHKLRPWIKQTSDTVKQTSDTVNGTSTESQNTKDNTEQLNDTEDIENQNISKTKEIDSEITGLNLRENGSTNSTWQRNILLVLTVFN